jgi:hypothetical protein
LRARIGATTMRPATRLASSRAARRRAPAAWPPRCRRRAKGPSWRRFGRFGAPGNPGGTICANGVALWEEVGYGRTQRAGVEGLLPLLHLGSVSKLGDRQWFLFVAPSTIRSTRRTA